MIHEIICQLIQRRLDVQLTTKHWPCSRVGIPALNAPLFSIRDHLTPLLQSVSANYRCREGESTTVHGARAQKMVGNASFTFDQEYRAEDTTDSTATNDPTSSQPMKFVNLANS